MQTLEIKAGQLYQQTYRASFRALNIHLYWTQENIILGSFDCLTLSRHGNWIPNTMQKKQGATRLILRSRRHGEIDRQMRQIRLDFLCGRFYGYRLLWNQIKGLIQPAKDCSVLLLSRRAVTVVPTGEPLAS